MEDRWIAEIQNTPTPAEGSLTERALTQVAPAKRVSLRRYVFAGVALAVTLPIAWTLLPKRASPPQEPVELAFGIPSPRLGIPNPLPAIQTTAPAMKNPLRANRMTTHLQSNPTPANLNPTGVIKNSTRANQFAMHVQNNPTPVNRIQTGAIGNPTPANLNPTGAISSPPQEKVTPPAAETQVALETEKRPELFAYHAPSPEKSLTESVRSYRPDDLVTSLQDKPTLEAVKEREMVQLELQQVTAADASSPSSTRTLLSLAPRALSASADPRLAGIKRLRYPLSPLPKVPQATVKKAELSVHADSGHVAGSVSVIPEKTERELLVAVFDQYGVLVATQMTPIPANAEKVEIKPFVAPASHYQLGLRPRFERDKSKLQIIGGYVGYEKHVEVPAPPGMEIGVGDANFYQSNVYKDHFVRFSATLSKKLLKQPHGEPSLTLHGIVQDDKGALLSVASEPLKNKPDAQQLDLDFGLLPETGGYEYKFVVTSAHRIVLEPDARFTVDAAKLESDGSMVLTPKRAYSQAEILEKPERGDFTQVKLSPSVVKALKAKGLTEFVGKSVEASGKSEKVLYTGLPLIEVTTVTVEKVEDVTVRQKPDASFTVDVAKRENDGSLILTPKLIQYPGPEIVKKPELRDHAQVTLTPDVVKALQARGLTRFEGKRIQASGKSEKFLLMFYPSIEITKVTVERVEDITFPEIEFEKP